MNYTSKKEFLYLLQDFLHNKEVNKLKYFYQHMGTTRFDHSMHVAYHSYIITKFLHLDYTSTARGALLHDFFLYDWRDHDPNLEFKGMHAYAHPKAAHKNATTLFELNQKEQDIILKHMWPVTFAFPKSLEAFIVTNVDKGCAIYEFFSHFIKILHKKKIYRNSYVFFSTLILE